MSRALRKNKRGLETIIASLLMVIIVVIMSVMTYAYSTGLLTALLQPPPQPKEGVKMEYFSFASTNNNVTLYLRNIGGSTLIFTAYYVKDASGNQYSKTNWAGLQESPTVMGPTNILISSACTGCVVTGSSFTFSSGNSYTVTLVSSRNSLFTFSVVP